jgi:hypothetical protein
MRIDLTEEQRQAVRNGEPVRIPVPEVGGEVVLLRREKYDNLASPPRLRAIPNGAEGVPAGIRRSQEAYWRDLPKLLRLRSENRRWVAYRGDKRLGCGRTMVELYQECARRGIASTDVYVDRLEPRVSPPWEEEVLEVQFESEEASPAPQQ